MANWILERYGTAAEWEAEVEQIADTTDIQIGTYPSEDTGKTVFWIKKKSA